MESKECAICFEVVSEETGFVQMSCKHQFHFCCLGAWFSSQFVNKQNESCPCCRHEATEKERLPKRGDDEKNQSFSDLHWDESRIIEDFIPISSISLDDSFIQITEEDIETVERIRHILR